ncbi:unnamed protein product [Ophioblennius macclurei]
MSNTGLIERVRDPPKPPIQVTASCSGLHLVLAIAQIAIGSVYLNDCPRNHYIPIYLIVMGVFGILCWVPGGRQKEDEPSNPCVSIWRSLTSAFLFCWFIAGNVWIYSIYQPDFQRNAINPDQYCNKTLYLFAFWSTTAGYIILGVFLVCGCCSLVCMLCCLRNASDVETPDGQGA